MEHPVKEIPNVIKSLTEGSPLEQQKALETYFSPSASFLHPMCRVPSFSRYSLPILGDFNSRWVIWMIYRWYKILSPKIVLDVHSAVLDQKTLTLYVAISQVFKFFFVPQWFHKPEVSLVTVLKLSHEPETNKYLIESQQDLYQSNEVVKFVGPIFNLVVMLWQLLATGFCILGALSLAPVTMLEQRVTYKKNGVH